MKKIISIISALFLASVSFAQIDMGTLTKSAEGLFMQNNAPYSGKVFKKYPNGTIGIFGELKDGKKEGVWKWWWSDGSIKRESTYVQDKKEGLTYYWHKNGLKAKEIMYRNDRNIDQRLWDEKGKEYTIEWDKFN